MNFLDIVMQISFLNNALLIGFFLVFGLVFWKESNNPNSTILWTDLLTDSRTKKVSLDKLGQFWGIAISSWMMIFLTQTASAYAILPMLFPAYLAYLAGSYAFSKWMKTKDSTEVKDKETPP